jgi:hypothetical protein
MTDDLNTPGQEENLRRQNKGSDEQPWQSDEQPYADRPEQGAGDLRQEQDDVPAQEPTS